jgi:hypothetical protein
MHVYNWHTSISCTCISMPAKINLPPWYVPHYSHETSRHKHKHVSLFHYAHHCISISNFNYLFMLWMGPCFPSLSSKNSSTFLSYYYSDKYSCWKHFLNHFQEISLIIFSIALHFLLENVLNSTNTTLLLLPLESAPTFFNYDM